MKRFTQTKHIVSAIVPRLSDEDVDPLERDDPPAEVNEWMTDDWLPWDPEDVADIKRLITEKMPEKQQEIIQAFLDGLNYNDLHVTEKYWRYHFAKGIEFIKKELKL
jgi:hypothetical protein